MENSKNEIISLLKTAEDLIPKKSTKSIQNEWQDYEYEIWRLGEDIRQIFVKNKSLRKDKDLLKKIVSISLNREAKRGRQSFIMLLGNVNCTNYAKDIITQIDDEYVAGHIIDSVYKMKNSGFCKEIEPFCQSKTTWIKNIAKKYITQFSI